MFQRRTSGAMAAALAVIAASFAIQAAPASAAAPSAGHLPPVSEDVIVQLDPLAGETIDDLNSRHGTITIDSIASTPGMFLIGATDGRTQAVLAGELGAAPGVLSATANGAVTSPEVTGLPFKGLWSFAPPSAATAQYARALLNLPGAQAISTGAGVTVAVIDSGVQLLPAPHPALAAALVAGTDIVDGDDVPDDARAGVDTSGNGIVDEEAGHGTHVAGIVHMVAPDAKIMPVRALDSDGVGTTFDVAKAMYWAADHGATVVSMSLGMHGSAGPLKQAAADLQARGVVVVAAAGNDGRARANYPAAARCVVAVGSSGPTDAVSSFSSLGDWVSVTAPGEDVTSTFPFTSSGFASWSGTSMATPFVSGQAALLRSLKPALTNGEVLSYIAGTAAPHAAGSSALAGSGRIDIVASLRAAASDQLPSPAAAGIDKNCTA